jgi:hypothetical protein
MIPKENPWEQNLGSKERCLDGNVEKEMANVMDGRVRPESEGSPAMEGLGFSRRRWRWRWERHFHTLEELVCFGSSLLLIKLSCH